MLNPKLPLRTKLVYGSGAYGLSAFSMLRQIFYAIFLTDVVGLDPRLASFGALAGLIWDAVNDPLVGLLSDRTRTRWGRRRPFLLWFTIPFGLGFMLQWWAPPIENQVLLTAYITFVFMFTDTLGTLIAVPYTALTPEIALDYDERTSLTAWRMFFMLSASLTTALVAPNVVDAALRAGYTQQRGYLVVAALFGGVAILPLFLIFAFIKEKLPPPADTPSNQAASRPINIAEPLQAAWRNIPFRFAALINLLNWMAVDLTALILPYFLLYWIAGGDLMAQVQLFGIHISLEAGVLGLLLLVAILVIPFWTWVSGRLSKRSAYIIGISAWIAAAVLLFLIGPGQANTMLAIAALAGVGVAAAHVLPEALFPDVVEWDELRTHRRQEGIYYGIRNFIRKLTGALAIFLALQVLGWSGYQARPEAIPQFMQPASTLTTIRLLAGPVGATLLTLALVLTWFYPLTRERHGRIRKLLEKRMEKINRVGL